MFLRKNIKEILSHNINYIKREKTYIFYFFTYFNPKEEFIEVLVNGTNWGRYDIISKDQYGINSLYWVPQLFDNKNYFWDMKYNYVLFLPTIRDMEDYLTLIDKIIFKD